MHSSLQDGKHQRSLQQTKKHVSTPQQFHPVQYMSRACGEPLYVIMQTAINCAADPLLGNHMQFNV